VILMNSKKLGFADGDTLDYIKTCKDEYGGDGKILTKIGVSE